MKTVIAISQEARTFQQIVNSIEKVERQGRYYCKAEEIIGMIYTAKRNQSTLTSLSQAFVKNNPTLTNPVLLQGVLNSRIFQRVVPYLESKDNAGVGKLEFENF